MSCPAKLFHHHVGIIVSNMERSIAWYEDILGFKLMDQRVYELPIGSQPMAFLKNGDAYLELYERPDSTPKDFMADYWGKLGTFHTNFWIPDEEFDAFREHLIAKGVPIMVDGKHEPEACGKPTGCRVLYFTDPDGNLIEATDSYTPGEY